jgi:hypothetical protein
MAVTFEFGCMSPPSQTSGRQADIHARLQEIRIPYVRFKQADIFQVARWLTRESKRRDPSGRGVEVIVDEPEFRRRHLGRFGARITVTLQDVPLGTLLQYVIPLASLEYKITADQVVIEPWDSHCIAQ